MLKVGHKCALVCAVTVVVIAFSWSGFQARPTIVKILQTKEEKDFLIRREVTGAHRVQLSQRQDGTLLIFGDSLAAGFCLTCQNFKGLNLGIGRDTTTGLLSRLPRLYEKDQIVITIGVNDLKSGVSVDAYERSLSTLFEKMHPVRQIIISTFVHALPSEWRSAAGKACRNKPNCLHLDLGLPDDAVAQDRIHLTAEGYKIWASRLRAVLD